MIPLEGIYTTLANSKYGLYSYYFTEPIMANVLGSAHQKLGKMLHLTFFGMSHTNTQTKQKQFFIFSPIRPPWTAVFSDSTKAGPEAESEASTSSSTMAAIQNGLLLLYRNVLGIAQGLRSWNGFRGCSFAVSAGSKNCTKFSEGLKAPWEHSPLTRLQLSPEAARDHLAHSHMASTVSKNHASMGSAFKNAYCRLLVHDGVTQKVVACHLLTCFS